MPPEEVGQLALPSVWLKSVEFSGDYEIHDGIAFDTSQQCRADAFV